MLFLVSEKLISMLDFLIFTIFKKSLVPLDQTKMRCAIHAGANKIDLGCAEGVPAYSKRLRNNIFGTILRFAFVEKIKNYNQFNKGAGS